MKSCQIINKNLSRLFLVRNPFLSICGFLLVLFLITGCNPEFTETMQPTMSLVFPTASQTSVPEETKPVEPSPEPEQSVTEMIATALTSTLVVATNTGSQSSTPTETVNPEPSLSPTNTIFLSPTKTVVPTRTPYPSATRRPSRTPSITPSPTAQLAFYRINNLGMYSKVISPVRPEAIVSPGEDGLITVEIISDSNLTISKEVFNYQSYINRHIGIAPEIDFELDGVAEFGRLIISSYDRYERLMWLTSVDLVLLSIGKNQIDVPKNLTEPYIIRSPKENEEISGGMLEVSGVARILNTNPIIVECINPDGSIISSTLIELHAPIEGMSHIPFTVYLPYQVPEATNIRLTIRQESNNRIPGTISLFSQEIVLLP